MKEIKLTLFATTTPAGRELAVLLDNFFASEFPGGLKVKMASIVDGDLEDMTIAGLQDDIVVFDASVEDDIGSNYKTTNMWPLCMDHFLVVSRTRLPINFRPFHEGGSPDTCGDLLDRPFSLSNQQLILWIEKQLKLLAPQLPRPESERLEIPKGKFVSHGQAFGNLTMNLITKSLERREVYRKNTGQAFISYLSCYSRHHRQGIAPHGFYAEDLIGYIKEWHSDPDYSVLYYPPGSLSSEFMAEYRRWQIVRMIEDRIRAADEFWIFETDDYYNSWWTQAELAMLAYIQHDDRHPVVGKRPAPKVMLCKPTQSQGLVVREADAEFIQKLEEKTAGELMRRLVHNDSYEGVRLLQIVGRLPTPIQWLLFQSSMLFQKFLEKVSGFSLTTMASQDGLNLMDFESAKESLNFHANSQSFWNDRIVTCPNCMGHNEARNNFDFPGFVMHKRQGQFRISSRELELILATGIWKCNGCGLQFQIIQEPHSQFRYWNIRGGRPTGPNGVFVERIPLYSLERMS